MNARASAFEMAERAARPRLGFVGVGWIGAHRLRATAESGLAEIAGIADASAEAAGAALRSIASSAPCARVARFESLLEAELDGLVIATPSAMHAEQAITALEHGCAVFCQKPLARTRTETAEVIAAAQRLDRLLAVDFCYREVAGMREARELALSGSLGEIFAADLIFHNAYGPDKPWFYDVRASGGGCLIDLGIHLVDLLLWALDYPSVERVSSRLYAGGNLLPPASGDLEDYAAVELHLSTGATARLACSWRLAAGRDAIIEVTFYGTRGSVALRNVGGSFYDFIVEHREGTRTRTLAAPPDAWGGRAICAWARQLASHRGFDPQAGRLADVSAVIDEVYGR